MIKELDLEDLIYTQTTETMVTLVALLAAEQFKKD